MKDNFNPISVLKIYKPIHSSDTYVEVHDIKNIKGEFVEQAGKPLTREAYNKLFLLTTSKEDQGKSFFKRTIIDPKILSFHPYEPHKHICWYNIAQRRTIEIKMDKVFQITCYFPATLYLVKNGKLNIYALASNTRPDMKTEIYKMPLPNLNSVSTFCWGNVEVKEAVKSSYIDEEIRIWEKVVWNSQFDSYNIGNLLSNYRNLEFSGKRYPKRFLKKLDETLKDIL